MLDSSLITKVCFLGMQSFPKSLPQLWMLFLLGYSCFSKTILSPWVRCLILNLSTHLLVRYVSLKKGRNYKVRVLFLENIISAPPAISYWNRLFDNLNWKNIWSIQHRFFLTNKVKEISFKLVHNIYPVKNFLQKKIRSDFDTNCSFCQNDIETLLHLFWSCSYTRKLWKDVSWFISRNILQNFSMNPQIVIFWFFEADSNACFIINLIIFLCRFYIHKCKFSNCKPILLVFLHEIKHYLNTISSSLNPKAIRTCKICTTYKLFTLLNV